MPKNALQVPKLKSSRCRFPSRVTTVKRTRRGKLVACCSGAAVAVDPAAVVAGNKTGSAALHVADGVAGCTDTGALAITAIVFIMRSGSGADGEGKSE
jgi:hypothetical protein